MWWIIFLIIFGTGYVPTTRWLFYKDRLKQEKIELRYLEAQKHAEARYERRLDKYLKDKETWEKKEKWGTYYGDYPYREEINKRDYKFRSREESGHRALGLGLFWIYFISVELGILVPKVMSFLLFRKLRTPFERKKQLEEMNKRIAELEETELPPNA